MNQEAEDRVFDNLNYRLPLQHLCGNPECGKHILSSKQYCEECRKDKPYELCKPLL
jgi:uncharacterized OB-fold protein